ncbi:u3 small nucleolar RNA-associated protein 18 homolog [Nephila pilipes]|uniref:U3 small nucleolar RNA-associated protein 18 homolog n=1 Tax=Nephila pilipes TaxID=299642 RepID=A0A8X6TCW4_NEPPI|nr:u3 small nucleolar RNA-associated protein 18 homolog [Nephila pilipes]
MNPETINTHKEQVRKQKRLKMKNKPISLTDSNYGSPSSLKRPRKLTSTEEVIKLKHKKQYSEEAIVKYHEMREILGVIRPPDEKEIELEQLLFGRKPDDLEDEEISLDDDDELTVEETQKSIEKLAAWVDEDDETLLVKHKPRDKAKSKRDKRGVSLPLGDKYLSHAQEKFVKLMGTPKWAEQCSDSKDSDDERDNELLQRTSNFIKPSESLPKGNIDVRKTPKLEDSTMAASPIKSIEFHPTARVAVVASTKGVANLFQIDGQLNEKIQSIRFENFPICTAHFTVDGTEIVVGSIRFMHFFSYDMLAGKISMIPLQKGMEKTTFRRFLISPDGKYIVIQGRYGNIHLMAARSKQWIGSLKMNGEVISITFNRDGTKLYSFGDTGEVYVWDMSSRKCIHKFVDEGCITGTSIALSPNDQFLATGSDSGVVNVYDNSTLYDTSSPQPKKVFKNLTTEITNLKFNCTSEILAMSSSFKADAVKLVHVPSLTVFSNFPGWGNYFKHPNSVDISTNSGYMCIGNNVGTAYIYRLKHYKNY